MIEADGDSDGRFNFAYKGGLLSSIRRRSREQNFEWGEVERRDYFRLPVPIPPFVHGDGQFTYMAEIRKGVITFVAGDQANPGVAALEDGQMAEIEDRLNALRSPFRTAEKFWVEEIIDPRKTRSLLCDFARLAEPVRKPGPVSFAIRP